MVRLKLWVTRYFVHYNRLIDGKPDPSANEDIASRFVLDVLDDANTAAEIKALNLPDDLSRASQEHFRSLTRIFDTWAEGVLSNTKCGVRDEDGDIIFSRRDNPRFCDFLVIDEGALRSLAALPAETPPLDIVPREERLVGHFSPLQVPSMLLTSSRARAALYSDAYVWLVDSQAVKSFDSFEHVQASSSTADWANRCHNGWLKLEPMWLDNAWFERLARSQDEHWVFERYEREQGSGDWWFEPS
jgi:hypothetical protein